MNDLRETIAQALASVGGCRPDFALCVETFGYCTCMDGADAVVAVLPTYEQVGWAYMLGFDPMPYLSVGEPLPRPEVHDVVPVYVKREAQP